MNEKEIIFEQYKLYVETAEKVSEKRQSANNFFLTINSVLLSFSGYLSTTDTNNWHMLIALTGIFISFFWLKIISSYKQLNSAKYKIIHAMEEKLPIQLFKDEWNLLGKGETDKYLKLTVVEKGVPTIFILIYFIILIFMLNA